MKQITMKLVEKEIKLFNSRYGFNPTSALLARIIGCDKSTIYRLLKENNAKILPKSRPVPPECIKRIIEERQKRGMSVSELAIRSGISPSTMVAIELGRFLPRDATLSKIVNVLKFSDDAIKHIAADIAAERNRRNTK